MRYRCTKCEVEWSTVKGEQNPVCWNCLSGLFTILVFDTVPVWRQGFEL